MAQITKAMLSDIISYAEQGKRFPLTLNELTQLALLATRQLDEPAPEAGKQKHFGTIGHTRIPGMSPMFPTATEASEAAQDESKEDQALRAYFSSGDAPAQGPRQLTAADALRNRPHMQHLRAAPTAQPAPESGKAGRQTPSIEAYRQSNAFRQISLCNQPGALIGFGHACAAMVNAAAPEAAPMPAQAVTLTDDEIAALWIEVDDLYVFARRLLGSAKTGEAK